MSSVEVAGWWRFNVVWSCPPDALALEPPRRYRPRSTATYVLLEATWCELQSDLQMAATCAGLGGAQVKPSCKPRLTAVSAGAAAT